MSPATALALTGGAPAVDLPAPRWPQSGDLEVAWMEAVVRSGEWSWLGPHERAFCRDYAAFIGTPYCACLANGTVTLQCALQAVGVKPGDEVIVPALTWVATMQAALDIGASVVLADIDPDTYCLDPAAAEAALTPRTKAIIPVHLYGCMCDMDALLDVARRHDLKVIEDVAHQQGSRWRNVGAGALGEVGSYSFQQSKILTCGEGGAITCKNEEVYNTIFALKHVGWSRDGTTPATRYGHNYRFTEMQAVLLRGGLQRLPEQLRVREENVARIREGLERIGGPLRVARRDPRVTRQAYYALTLHFDPDQAQGVTRSHYAAALGAEGCPVGAPYPPVYRSPLLNLHDDTSPIPFRASCPQDYASLRLPVTERVCEVEGLVMMHWLLLGSEAYTLQLLQAIEKVNDRLEQVKAHYASVEA